MLKVGVIGGGFTGDMHSQCYKAGGEIESPKVSESVTAEGSIGNVSSLGGYIKEIEYFLDLCEGKDVPKVITPEEAVVSLKLIKEELKQAEKGRR